MIPVFIYCPACRKNLITEMPDGQVWDFEDGKVRCDDCRVTLTVQHVLNNLIWNDDPDPENN